MAGLYLDDWQQYLLTNWLGETEDGRWSAPTIGLMVSRQNGKGALLEARELAGLFLLEEPLIVHSAHLQDTANVHFRRLVDRIFATPALAARLAKPRGILRGHGTESINLAVNPETGIAPRLEVRTRTGKGGLGFSINCLVFDEAMIISDEMHQALIPTLSAQSIDGNLQRIYTGSAVDEDNPSHQGVPFARIREQGLAKTPGMMYSEWSLDIDDPAKVELAAISTEDLAETNPGLGIRIAESYIRQDEIEALGGRGAAVQRLGVGKWPRTDGLEGVVITPEAWGKCYDCESTISGQVVFALDIDPIRAHAAVCVAGFREDGLAHVEVIKQGKPKACVEWLIERVEKHQPLAVILDGLSGAFASLPELSEALKEKGLIGGLHEQEVTVLGSKEHGQACGMFFDAVDQLTLRHLGQIELAEALRGAVKRNMTDAWAWHRRDSSVNITPLVGCTLALWGILTMKVAEPRFWDLNDYVDDEDLRDAA